MKQNAYVINFHCFFSSHPLSSIATKIKSNIKTVWLNIYLLHEWWHALHTHVTLGSNKVECKTIIVMPTYGRCLSFWCLAPQVDLLALQRRNLYLIHHHQWPAISHSNTMLYNTLSTGKLWTRNRNIIERSNKAY